LGALTAVMCRSIRVMSKYYAMCPACRYKVNIARNGLD
jgi:hypothetical protein